MDVLVSAQIELWIAKMSRKSISLSVVALAVVLVASFTLLEKLPLGAHTVTPPVAMAAAALPMPDIKSATTLAPPAKVLPPETTVHVVAKGESLPAIVHHYLPLTKFLTGSELEQAIRSANPEIKGIWPKPASEILIPQYKEHWAEKPVLISKSFEVRAIYLTGTMAGSAKGLEIIRKWREAGGNSVVFDIKDSDGSVSVPTGLPLAPDQKSYPIRNLPKFTGFLHAQGLHVIARIAVFRDDALVTKHPELAVQSRAGGAWRENGKLVWTDSSNPKVWEYNIGLAKFAAANGVDEIQFDYVRFPAEGDQKDTKFVFEAQHKDWTRGDAITHFLQQAQAEIKPMGVLFSLDVFGVMAWQRPIDLSHTGQDIPQMAKYCDVMSPMIYPSHFYGMDGYTDPGDAPEHFIGESMARFQKVTAESGVVLRPWLQAFGWRTKTYSPEYIRIQVAVAKSKGGNGFLFWNANNDYSKPYSAMPEMRQDKVKYFRGDEVQSFLGKNPGAGTGSGGAAN
jgi:hypothetical protein